MAQEVDDNSFVNMVFKNNPKPLKYYDVTFEAKDSLDLFENLLDIFTKGCVILYGENNKVNLNKLNMDDFNNLNMYFNSFGINLHFKINHISQISKIDNYVYDYKPINQNEIDKLYLDKIDQSDLVNYKFCKTNKLVDYKYQLRSDDLMYIIYFSFFT